MPGPLAALPYALTGLAALGGGLMSLSQSKGDKGPSQRDIANAMLRDLQFAQDLANQYIQTGTEAIEKTYGEYEKLGTRQIEEELGRRGLAGLKPGQLISASTPGEQTYTDFLSKLAAGKSQALADLKRQATAFAYQGIEPRLRATGMLAEPEEDKFGNFLSGLVELGGYGFGMTQQARQTKLLEGLLNVGKDTTENLDLTLQPGSVNTYGMRRM